MVTVICASAQTQPGEPRPGATPDPEDRSGATVEAKKIDPETVVELGASYEFVNKDLPDWQTYYFFINHKFSTGQVLYGTASAVRRFETTDANFMIGYVQPLTESKRWIATVEAAGARITKSCRPLHSLGRSSGSSVKVGSVARDSVTVVIHQTL